MKRMFHARFPKISGKSVKIVNNWGESNNNATGGGRGWVYVDLMVGSRK
jgi:hypothetical protein